MRARKLTDEQITAAFKKLVPMIALRPIIEDLFTPKCIQCGSTERVQHKGPTCHACYNKAWEKDKRALYSRFTRGQVVLWEGELVEILAIGKSRISIRCPGETSSRYVTEKDLKEV